jgi:tetratricopeptide (TPR) repeat protein
VNITSPEEIRKTVDKLEGIVEWIADTFKHKRWIRRLLLLDVLIASIFHPSSLMKFGFSYIGRPLPYWYQPVFWVAVSLPFAAAVIVALKRGSAHVADRDDRSPVKGLVAFDSDDTAIFAKLQRELDVIECLQSISDADFHFGILTGQSGSGKTSFLRAGLAPRLAARDHVCIYVRFTDFDPVETIRQTCIRSLNHQFEEPSGLPQLFESVATVTGKPTVFLFDQFEQFFIHRKLKKDRDTFVLDFANWYGVREKLQVKVVLSIRDEFLWCLHELQQVMSYSLSPRQNYRIECFEPSQTVEIFRVMSETVGVNFDEKFMRALAETELLQPDGKVLATDVQMLAWMLTGRRLAEDRGFTAKSYQRLGGMEGLMERYVADCLEARETPDKRKVALDILLALIDLPSDTRTGPKTIKALHAQLGTTELLLREAAEWLARSDVRLVTYQKEGFELAHERLIPAVRRVGRSEVSQAEKASRLLDQRVNEWLGSDKNSRFLLNWRERRLVEKYKRRFDWGHNKRDKEVLLARSKARTRRRAMIPATGFGLLLMGLGWWESSWGQAWQIRREFLQLAETRVGDEDFASEIPGGKEAVVEALASEGRFSDAMRVAKRKYSQDGDFSAAARGAAAHGDIEDARAAVNKSFTTLSKLGGSPGDDDYVLMKVAQNAVFVGMLAKDATFLDRALGTLHEKQQFDYETLSMVAMACPKLRNANDSIGILQRVVKTVSDRKDFGEMDKGLVLAQVIKAASQVPDAKSAAVVIQEAIAAFGNKGGGFLDGALQEAARTEARLLDAKQANVFLERLADNAESKRDTLEVVRDDVFAGHVMHTAGQYASAVDWLSKAVENSKSIDDHDLGPEVSLAVTDLALELNDDATASQFLDRAIALSATVEPGAFQKIRETRAGVYNWPYTGGWGFQLAARKATRLGDRKRMNAVFDRLTKAANEIDDYFMPSVILSATGKAAARRHEMPRAINIAERLASIAREMKSPYAKACFLTDAAEINYAAGERKSYRHLLQEAVQNADAATESQSEELIQEDFVPYLPPAFGAARVGDTTLALELFHKYLQFVTNKSREDRGYTNEMYRATRYLEKGTGRLFEIRGTSSRALFLKEIIGWLNTKSSEELADAFRENDSSGIKLVSTILSEVQNLESSREARPVLQEAIQLTIKIFSNQHDQMCVLISEAAMKTNNLDYVRTAAKISDSDRSRMAILATAMKMMIETDFPILTRSELYAPFRRADEMFPE